MPTRAALTGQTWDREPSPVPFVQHELLEAPVTVYNFQVESYHTYYVGESGIRVHNANCKNTTTLWDIKRTNQTVKYNYHGTETTAYYDGKYYWAKDYGAHNSVYKVFERRGNYLFWIADADAYGNFITGKHKSEVGLVVRIG